ncbi:unnamed protein product [Pipistrellus nathusii]|uniref:Uncharacterized protein n=1 Tax=Pipistrellus nathusii TaxID=59473 RepID=A0ABP0A1T7_PIPNA
MACLRNMYFLRCESSVLFFRVDKKETHSADGSETSSELSQVTWERSESDQETRSQLLVCVSSTMLLSRTSKHVSPSLPFKDNMICLKVDSLIKVNGALKSAASLKLAVCLLYNFGIIENS